MNEMQRQDQKDDLDAHYEEMDDLGRDELVHFARLLVAQSLRRQPAKRRISAQVITLPVRLLSRAGD